MRKKKLFARRLVCLVVSHNSPAIWHSCEKAGYRIMHVAQFSSFVTRQMKMHKLRLLDCKVVLFDDLFYLSFCALLTWIRRSHGP